MPDLLTDDEKPDRHSAVFSQGRVQLTINADHGAQDLTPTVVEMTGDEASQLAAQLVCAASWADLDSAPWGGLSTVVSEYISRRERQRSDEGTDDDQRSDAEWREMHASHLEQAFTECSGVVEVAGRQMLMHAFVALGAHIESIDRQSALWPSASDSSTDDVEVIRLSNDLLDRLDYSVAAVDDLTQAFLEHCESIPADDRAWLSELVSTLHAKMQHSHANLLRCIQDQSQSDRDAGHHTPA